MKYEEECPIWSTSAKVSNGPIDGKTVISPRAGGKYFISDTTESVLQGKPKDQKKKLNVRLTTWLVEQRRAGIQCPEINTRTVDEANMWDGMGITERADRILQYLSDHSEYLGVKVIYSAPFYSTIIQENITYFELLAYSGSEDSKDFTFLLDYLSQQDYIEHGKQPDQTYWCILKVKGHKRLEELGKINIDSSTVFVAMWFHDSMNTAWEDGIEPAIKAAGYKPIRIDEKHHIGKIDDEIIAEIRRAKFVVADFTQGEDGARGGVYYEAGFAHGLNIPVIFTCRASSLQNLHFDTRQYNHISWETEKQLMEELYNRICAVIGEGPNNSPN